MKISRRNFVQTLGAAAAITISGGGVKALAGTIGEKTGSSVLNSNTLLSMNANEIKGFVGRRFAAKSLDGSTVDLVLAEVTSISRKTNLKRGYSGECFSAIFKSRGEEALSQGVYEMRAAGLDNFSALLVPTGRKRAEFELVVNHLKR
jgi:hypothetical protein